MRWSNTAGKTIHGGGGHICDGGRGYTPATRWEGWSNRHDILYFVVVSPPPPCLLSQMLRHIWKTNESKHDLAPIYLPQCLVATLTWMVEEWVKPRGGGCGNYPVVCPTLVPLSSSLVGPWQKVCVSSWNAADSIIHFVVILVVVIKERCSRLRGSLLTCV